MSGEAEDLNEGGVDPNVEKEARNLGWVPLEEFKGNADHWVDADEFVTRGNQLMPILRQNNKRLQKTLDKQNETINNLTAQLRNAETVMTKLEKHYSEANRRAVELAKVQLKEELKQAREDNDLDAELEIREKLDDIREREREIDTDPQDKKQPKEQDKKTPQGYSPEFLAWKEENPWFEGPSKEDKKKTKLITRIAEDLREEGTDLVGSEFLDECVRVYEEQYGEQEEEEEKPTKRRAASKVDAPSNRNNGRSGAKGWNDLPAAAKQACLEDQEEFVGPDKKYKTLDGWKKRYCEIYFAQED